MRKKIAILCLGVCLVLSQGIVSNAQEPIQYMAEEENEITRADVIVTMYRVNNHKVQYRRWNETRGYWVDPDWIDL